MDRCGNFPHRRSFFGSNIEVQAHAFETRAGKFIRFLPERMPIKCCHCRGRHCFIPNKNVDIGSLPIEFTPGGSFPFPSLFSPSNSHFPRLSCTL